MIQFANGYFLLLIPLLIVLFSLYVRKRKAAIRFSSIRLLKRPGAAKTVKHKIGKFLILIGLILSAVALARPQLVEQDARIDQEGIDIAMVLDVSGSMQSVDFEPNRLEVARETMLDFIGWRPYDRIAFIVFAGTAYTRVPLTLDHNVVKESLAEVGSESVNEDGTAIGMAISVGLNRLKTSEASSKVLILVTDGDNNAGSIDPGTAAGLAKETGVKLYAVGVGTDRTILPVQMLGQTRYQQVEGGLNEELLRSVAETTGGQYFRAKDSRALSDVFASINELEKTAFDRDHFQQYTELAFLFLQIALVLLLVGIFLDSYYFIQIP